MGGSIRTGVSFFAEEPDVEAVIILLCNQPLMTSETILSLLEIRAATDYAIIASEYNGVPGPPCVFDRALFPELSALAGAEGARRIITKQDMKNAVYRNDFPQGATDIDTMDDWERLQERLLTEDNN